LKFTRYPDGLVQAFEVLENGGKSTKMENPSSKEYAHAMMFGIGGELFATHPRIFSIASADLMSIAIYF
jgi:hypothetical protein